jgi:hypothetical protein
MMLGLGHYIKNPFNETIGNIRMKKIGHGIDENRPWLFPA